MLALDSKAWVERQFSDANLGDQRRQKRLAVIAQNMLNQPEESLPTQNVEWKDLKAAYRFFDCEDVTFEAITSTHWQQTRATEPGRYLLISDTTDIDYFSHRATTGLGQLGKGDGRGMQLHSCLMFNTETMQLHGVAGAQLTYRVKASKDETRTERLARRRESEVWGDGVEQVGSPPPGSQWIHVFDRGGDNFEAMCHIKLRGCDWVIRVGRLQRKVLTEAGDEIHLNEALQEAREVGSYELFIRAKQGVAARTAKIRVSTLTVTLPKPRHSSEWLKQCDVKEIKTNVLIVEEVTPPKGVQKVCWILYTSLPINTMGAAWQVITDYENRWIIEEYHKVLKTGCVIEEHALRKAERLEPLIGLITVIGTRLLQIKFLGRTDREAKAKTHIPAAWVRTMELLRPNLNTKSLTVYHFFRELAKLGGFLARKCDGEPGWQKIWKGYRKMQQTLDTMRLAG